MLSSACDSSGCRVKGKGLSMTTVGHSVRRPAHSSAALPVLGRELVCKAVVGPLPAARTRDCGAISYTYGAHIGTLCSTRTAVNCNI